jgi:hypothetical protein
MEAGAILLPALRLRSKSFRLTRPVRTQGANF